MNSVLKGKISNIKDLSIYINIEEFGIDGFMHANDISYLSKPEYINKDKRFKKFKLDKRGGAGWTGGRILYSRDMDDNDDNIDNIDIKDM